MHLESEFNIENVKLKIFGVQCLVNPLPHSSSDLSTVLTSIAVCMKFSLCDGIGFQSAMVSCYILKANALAG